jgi:uncharacterized protein (DUF2235 family)
MSKQTYNVAREGEEIPRNLLVFLDGTWNDENGRDGDGAVTNIYKLFSSLTASRVATESLPHERETANHLGLYFRGVGNDEENIISMGYYKGAFGAGERNIRDHAYACICKHYKPGDRICIFGFSRGAASARLLASKLNEHGLPSEITLHYRKAKNKNTGNEEPLFTKYSAKDESKKILSISFLGLFDTVGAFGIPIDIGPLNFQKINLFRDLTVARNVERVVHLVAIDESRTPFIPTLTNKSDRIEEVWFAGVHADIGGGYLEGRLGNIALDFMVNRLEKYVQSPSIKFLSRLDSFRNYDLDEDEFVIHYHGDGIAKKPREIHVLKSDKPTAKFPAVLHQSVNKLRKVQNFYYSERLNSFATRVPIKYAPRNVDELGDNFLEEQEGN